MMKKIKKLNIAKELETVEMRYEISGHVLLLENKINEIIEALNESPPKE